MSFSRGNMRKFIMLGLVGATLVVSLAGIAASHIAASARNVDANTAYALLQHTPYGNAELKWNAKSENLTVEITVRGLAQNSTHPAHIHLGDCSTAGAVKYMLNNVVANAAGVGTSTTVIPNVADGIAATGWYVNVHNGPGLTSADQALPITCGNILNPHNAHNLKVALGPTNTADQNVSGVSLLTLEGNTLTVIVVVRGLVPGSAHADHIHVGTCQKQVPGSVMYALKPLVADQDGNASAVTTLNNVARIPEKGWYINVHRTTVLTDQTGFDPIACGNVQSN